MNKNQGISLAVAVTLIVIVFIGFGQMINDLTLNPKIVEVNPDSYSAVERLHALRGESTMEQPRYDKIESTTKTRNIIIFAVGVIELMTLYLLRTKKASESLAADGIYENLLEEKDESNSNKELIKSLLTLKENGVLSEEEFIEKINKLS